MADEYFQRNPEERKRPRIAAQQHGRQSDGKTWVLNAPCQIDEEGDQLDENDSRYIWMEDYLPIKSVDMCRSIIVVPLKKKSFASLLRRLKNAVPGIANRR